MKPKELLKEIAELPVAMRAQLVNEILHTLNPTDPEVSQAWIDEAYRRIESFQQGKSTLIPGKDVFQKAEAIISQ